MFVLDFHEDRNIALSLSFNRHLSGQNCSLSFPGNRGSLWSLNWAALVDLTSHFTQKPLPGNFERNGDICAPG